MKALILTGGTGSIALQTGIFNLYEQHPGLEVKVMTNAYDNGKSTGTVRRVMNGAILGPSDVRKNQTTRLKLEQPRSPLNDFLDIRFDLPANQVESYCHDKINELTGKIDPLSIAMLNGAIKAYFQSPNALRVDYTDFSIANIIYAGLAVANGNSLRAAATAMATVLGIQDNVILNDDTSLFLGAISASGVRLTDEGDIVEWGNKEDPLVDIFFYDEHGNDSKPRLNAEAIQAIEEANLIILSSGTQWSSLIPTYASEGFREAVQRSKAKIIMVMNTIPDKDSPGQTAGDIVKAIVPKYFPHNRVNVLCNATGNPQMGESTIDEAAARTLASVHSIDMSPSRGPNTHDGLSKTHNSQKLATAVFKVYFDFKTQFKKIISDYDDTLVARGNEHFGISKENMRLMCSIKADSSIQGRVICTGNTIKIVNTDLVEYDVYSAWANAPRKMYGVVAYADGGINRYHFSDTGSPILNGCVDEGLRLSKEDQHEILKVFHDCEIPMSKVENRGNVCMSIKPVDKEFRKIVARYLQTKLSNFKVTESGRTTIDIFKPGVSKQQAIVEQVSQTQDPVLYIGDEVYNGNDAVALDIAAKYPNLTVKNVSSVVETNILLKTLLINEQHY